MNKTKKNQFIVVLYFFRNLIILISFFFITGFVKQNDFCKYYFGCETTINEKYCTGFMPDESKNSKKTDERCKEFKRLMESGILPDSKYGFNIYSILCKKYRVDYEISDILPIKQKHFEFLVDNLPLTAKLVNAFQNTNYSATYLDKTHKKLFMADNGKNIHGGARLVAGSIPQKYLIYHGYGRVKILKWQLGGNIFFEFSYEVQQNEHIAYNIHMVVSPTDEDISAVLNFWLFKMIVQKNIKNIFADIVNSANAFNNISEAKLMQKYKWSKQEKSKIEELLKARQRT